MPNEYLNEISSINYKFPSVLWTPLNQVNGTSIFWTPIISYNGTSILAEPIVSAFPNVIVDPIPTGNKGWIETMPWKEIGTGVAVVAVVIGIGLIIDAPFTGAQSLWGFWLLLKK